MNFNKKIFESIYMESESRIKVGERYKINDGPYATFTCKVKEIKDDDTVLATVNLFGNPTDITVKIDYLGGLSYEDKERYNKADAEYEEDHSFGGSSSYDDELASNGIPVLKYTMVEDYYNDHYLIFDKIVNKDGVDNIVGVLFDNYSDELELQPSIDFMPLSHNELTYMKSTDIFSICGKDEVKELVNSRKVFDYLLYDVLNRKESDFYQIVFKFVDLNDFDTEEIIKAVKK